MKLDKLDEHRLIWIAIGLLVALIVIGLACSCGDTKITNVQTCAPDSCMICDGDRHDDHCGHGRRH